MLTLVIKVPGDDQVLEIDVTFCAWCTKAFIPKRKDHRFCSQLCKDTHKNKTTPHLPTRGKGILLLTDKAKIPDNPATRRKTLTSNQQ